MRFSDDETPAETHDRMLELQDMEDRREERQELYRRHGPASVTRDTDLKFKCLNCGSEPKVPWCPLCGGGAAA